MVTAIEEIPKSLFNKEKLSYSRVCDVGCQKCEKVYYSQPYDDGIILNLVKNTKRI